MNKFVIYTAGFFLFSFIGWILECVWCTVGETRKRKKFVPVNRGFLTGTLCPIYGSAALAMELCLRPFAHNLVIVFFLGIVVGDTVEYLTSYIMEKIFNARWWDYSNRFLNLNGRICLQHTVIWGFLCVVFIKYISPFTFGLIKSVPMFYLSIITYIALFLFLLDLFVAVVATIDINVLRGKIRAIINETEETPSVEVVEIGSSNTNGLTDRLNEFRDKLNSLSISRTMKINRILREMPLLKEQFTNQYNQLKNSVDVNDDFKEALKKMRNFFSNNPDDDEI